MSQRDRLDGEESAAKKKRAYVKYSPLSLLVLGVFAFVFSFSLFGVFEQTVLDLGGAETEDFGSDVFVPSSSDGDGSGEVTPEDPMGEWQQIAAEDIDVDSLPFLQTVGFDGLKEQNSDTVAWMYWPTTTDVKGLPFNRPVVQSTNNEYYLNKSFDKTNNNNGWIYVDYRCNMVDVLENKNLIIYGHARSYLMFGGLRYLNSKTKWQQDGNNHFIYINTPTERTVWQVFAWYETTTAFNYIRTHFSDDGDYVSFLNLLQSKNQISAFESFEFTAEDQILTLSTCKGSNSDVRIAMHAVLVKHEYVEGFEKREPVEK